MGSALQRLVDEVVGAVEGDPEAAPEILIGAAHQFRGFARQRENFPMAAMLAAKANEFEALARMKDHIRFPRRATVDDFEELEKEQAQAHAEVGQFDDLEQRARRDRIHETRHGRQHVSIAPESVTDKTALGRQITVKFNPSDDDKINKITAADTVVLWQGSKVEAQAFSLDVGVTSFPPLGTTVSCRPYGIVTYGSDGFQMSFMFDVGLGTRFTGVGNYCSVLVGQGAPRAPLVSGPMTVGASLGFFAAPSQAPLFYTQYADGVTSAPGSNTATVLRPPRATFLMPVQMTDPFGVALLEFLDYASVARFSLNVVAGGIVTPVPLTTEIAAVRITYSAGTSPVSYSLPFMLAT